MWYTPNVASNPYSNYLANIDLQLSVSNNLNPDPESYPESFLRDPSPLITHLLKLNSPSFVYRLLFVTGIPSLLFVPGSNNSQIHPILHNKLDHFYYPDYEYLSDLQILTIQVLNNFLDPNPPTAKLKMLGVSHHQYLAWLNDSLFHSTYLTHLQVTAPKAKPTALNSLISRALSGDPDSLKSVLSLSSPSNLKFGPSTHPSNTSYHVHSAGAQRMLSADTGEVVVTNTERFHEVTQTPLERPNYHYGP